MAPEGAPPSRTLVVRWRKREPGSEHDSLSRPLQHLSKSQDASFASPEFGALGMVLRNRAEERPLYRCGSRRGMIHLDREYSQGAAGGEGSPG